MVYSLNIILVYTITPVFLLLSIYLTFKTKNEYSSIQKRSLCTSILCFIYHESFIGFACYVAWNNTWPFFNLNYHLIIHYILGFIGFFPVFLGIFIYIFYLVSMKSVPRAIGLNSDDLITEGIFKSSRNPNSLARLIGLIGIGIAGRSFFTLFLAILWISVNHFNILIEEKHLENKFGDSYLQYYSLTPRYCRVIRK